MKRDYLARLFKLKGKVVLITGACGQLGRALCRAYRASGCRVIGLDADIKSGRLKDKAIEYIKCDITKKKSVEKTFNKVCRHFKKLDILVNNAGVSVFEPFEKRDETSFLKVTDVNLKGTFLCMKAFFKHIKKNSQEGNIVNIGSIYGVISPDPRIYTDCERRNSEVYGATKAGVIQMTRYFAVHMADYGVRVNCVSPGGIYNDENPQGKDFVKNYSFRCPMRRMAKAEEIVGAVLYLSSEAAAYTTGQNIVVDGGSSAW